MFLLGLILQHNKLKPICHIKKDEHDGKEQPGIVINAIRINEVETNCSCPAMWSSGIGQRSVLHFGGSMSLCLWSVTQMWAGFLSFVAECTITLKEERTYLERKIITSVGVPFKIVTSPLTFAGKVFRARSFSNLNKICSYQLVCVRNGRQTKVLVPLGKRLTNCWLLVLRKLNPSQFQNSSTTANDNKVRRTFKT